MAQLTLDSELFVKIISEILIEHNYCCEIDQNDICITKNDNSYIVETNMSLSQISIFPWPMHHGRHGIIASFSFEDPQLFEKIMQILQ